MLLDAIYFILVLIAFVLCLLVLWAVLSPIFYGLQCVIGKIGVLTFLKYHRLLRLRRFLLWPVQVYRFARDRLPLFDKEPSMRVAIDQRLTTLREQIVRARTAIELACDKVAQFGLRGPSALMKDISDLENRTQEVATLGGEIDEGILKDYQDRNAATANLVIGTILLILFAGGNGLFMNQFMHALIPNMFHGIPVSLAFCVIVVAVEAAGGWLIAGSIKLGSHERSRFELIGGAVCSLGSAIFEAGMIGLVSYNIDFDVDLFVEHPMLRFWMAPVGVTFTVATVCVSYVVHKRIEERAFRAGALRLRQELRTVNAYVKELPRRWETITNKAREAKAALDTFSTELGARDSQTADGAMSGLLAKVGEERSELVRTLASAKPDTWPEIVRASTTDDKREALRNVGLFILTAAALFAGYKGVEAFLISALSPPIILPIFGWAGISVLVVLAFYSLGFLSFERLQNVDSFSGRAFPHRAALAERVGSIAISVVTCTALLWCGWRGFGSAGFLLALALIAGGGALVWLGYHFERSCRAVRVLMFLLTTWSLVAISAISGISFFAMCWLLALVFWGLWIILRFLSLPFEVGYLWWISREPGRTAIKA